MAGGGGGGVMNWAIGIDMYTLICVKWMTNKKKKEIKNKHKKTNKQEKHRPLAVKGRNPNHWTAREFPQNDFLRIWFRLAISFLKTLCQLSMGSG